MGNQLENATIKIRNILKEYSHSEMESILATYIYQDILQAGEEAAYAKLKKVTDMSDKMGEEKMNDTEFGLKAHAILVKECKIDIMAMFAAYLRIESKELGEQETLDKLERLSKGGKQ